MNWLKLNPGNPQHFYQLLGILMFAVRMGAAEPPPPVAKSTVEAVLAATPQQRNDQIAIKPLKIVLLADRKDHGPGAHDYPQWQSRWALLLGGTNASSAKAVNMHGPAMTMPAMLQGASAVKVIQAQAWPEPDDWKTADLIVAFCYLSWNTQRIEQVRQYLQRGGGLVLIHSATWTKPKPSAEVAAVAGVGGFKLWRHGTLKVEMLQPQHPICLGLPLTFELEDESYWPPTPLADTSAIQVLAGGQERTNPGDATTSMQPLFWTYELDKGRVFGCVPGHYSWTFDHPYFRLLVLRGMAWAARENPYRFDALSLRGAVVKP
jgi:type 1 glutamine amidotransferase